MPAAASTKQKNDKPKNDKQILIRVTTEMRRDIEQAAIEDKVSLTEWLRRAVEYYMNARSEERRESYKKMMMDCLDDEEFRNKLLEKLNPKE